MLKGITRNGALLAGFTLVTTAILSLIYWLTAPKIALQVQKRTETLLHQVLAPDLFDNNLVNSCVQINTDIQGSEQIKVYRATSQNQPVAFILDASTPNGYNGQIRFLVSIKESGQIGGVRILEHAETPGLGDKIELRIDDWVLVFEDQPVQDVYESVWAVKKDGGKFDQFTGATITPRAVVSGVQEAVKFALTNREKILQATDTCEGSAS